MTLCFFAFALFQTIVGGVANSELTLFAHMARYLSPIGIYLIIKNSKYGLLLLKVGISATFFTHGLEALLREPLFVDFLIAALSIRENTAYYILYAIGIMDIFLAVLSPFARGPLIYFYMSFWGFITAFYRMLYEGGPGVLSLLMRSTHFLVPLFLGIYILKKSSNKNQGCL